MTRIERNVIPHAITNFNKELEAIKDSSIQAFFFNALAVSPQSFHDDKDLQEYIKKAFHILRGVLHKRGVDGPVRDALLGTTLICHIMFNEFKEDMRCLYTVAARTYLENRGLDKDINKGLWENIMRAIEGHNGSKGASPMLESKPGTAEQEVAYAFLVAGLSYLKLDKEEVYNG